MDPSWCPGCDRLILPRRYVVPANPVPAPSPPSPPSPASGPTAPAPPAPSAATQSPDTAQPSAPPSPNQPPAPAPTPSSPEVHKKLPRREAHHHHHNRHHYLPTNAHGIVHGTGGLQGEGRVDPPPGLGLNQRRRYHIPTLIQHPAHEARTPPKAVPSPPKPVPDAQVVGNPTAQSHMAHHMAQQRAAARAHAPVAPVAPAPVAPASTNSSSGRKTRVVISQEPTALYCSNECRIRDSKNSFLDSEVAGFVGAPAARDRVAQFELMLQTVDVTLKARRASSLPIVVSYGSTSPDVEPRVPSPPPNSLVEQPPELCSSTTLTSSSVSSALSIALSSALLASASSPQLHVPKYSTDVDSDGDTTPAASRRGTIRRSKSSSRPSLARSISTSTSASSHGCSSTSGSLPTWGSPSKGNLAPPKPTIYIATVGLKGVVASSASSIDSGLSTSTSDSSGAASALFDEDITPSLKKSSNGVSPGVDTCGTTPSRRGSGSSAESGVKKKVKRVSFASDAKPEALDEPPLPAGKDIIYHDNWQRPRRRNPLLDANPLRDAGMMSPKDRIQPSSLPSDLLSKPNPNPLSTGAGSHSSPAILKVVDTPSRHPRTTYSVAMWPEDEKRTTPTVLAHGELIREYASKFGPREGRELVWGPMWKSAQADAQFRSETRPWRGAGSRSHEQQPHSNKDYWMEYEEMEAEARARRNAADLVKKVEEERIIRELLKGAGMREEDQPQARKMQPVAYDGMPGPDEARGLTYTFDQFLYPLMPPKPKIVEKQVRRFDKERGVWVEETVREEIIEEPKKLFNFSED